MVLANLCRRLYKPIYYSRNFSTMRVNDNLTPRDRERQAQAAKLSKHWESASAGQIIPIIRAIAALTVVSLSGFFYMRSKAKAGQADIVEVKRRLQKEADEEMEKRYLLRELKKLEAGKS